MHKFTIKGSLGNNALFPALVIFSFDLYGFSLPLSKYVPSSITCFMLHLFNLSGSYCFIVKKDVEAVWVSSWVFYYFNFISVQLQYLVFKVRLEMKGCRVHVFDTTFSFESSSNLVYDYWTPFVKREKRIFHV